MRKHGTKFWLAVLLSLSMIVTMTPTMTFAAGSEGNPENDRYRIVAVNGFDSRFRLYEVLIGEAIEPDEYDTATPGYAFAGSAYNYVLRVDGRKEYDDVTWRITGDTSAVSNVVNQGQLSFKCVGTGEITIIASYEGVEVRRATITIRDTVATGRWGTNITWEIDSDGTLTLSGTGAMGELYNDENIDESQYDDFYMYNNLIKSVVVESGITSICCWAFSGCRQLTSVQLPNSVERINAGAFESCTSLRSITLPNRITSIENYTFENCKLLKKITMPETIENIGTQAFRRCYAITNFAMPKSLKTLGAGAFQGCTNLRAVTFFSGIRTINPCTFKNCKALESISIPDTVTDIEYSAFQNCYDLNTVVLPQNLKSIANSAFRNTALVNVVLPDTVLEIGDNAFRSCDSLKSITLPKNLEKIQQCLFYDCYMLESVNIPDKVTEIGDQAFRFCSRLRNVNLPEGLRTVGRYAFEDCSSLEEIILPSGFNKMGYGAFRYCTSLVSISLPDNLNVIPNHAFYNTGLTHVDIPYGVQRIEWGAFSECRNLESVTISETVSSVEEYAFAFCSSLHSVMIPKTVTRIGSAAFGYGKSGEYYDEYCSCWCESWEYEYQEDFLIEGVSGSEAERYANNNGLRFFEVGSDPVLISDCIISPIPEQSYKGSPIIPEIQIVDMYGRTLKQGIDFTVTCINNNKVGTATAKIKGDGVRYKGEVKLDFLISNRTAITDCTIVGIGEQEYTGDAIEPSVEIYDGNGNQLVEDRDYKLSYFNNIDPTDNATITITGMNNYCGQVTKTFHIRADFIDRGHCGKENLADIEWVLSNNGTLTLTGSGDMADYENVDAPWYVYRDRIEKVIVGDGITTVGTRSFADLYNLRNVQLGSDVIDIGMHAFRYDANLTHIDIPSNVQNIYGSAFANCNNLTSAKLNNGLKAIGEHAFYYCTSLKNIDIPDSVTSIAYGAFSYCWNLSNVILPKSIDEVTSGLFEECRSLESIVIPTGVSSIGSRAFEYCSSLQFVSIPNTVNTIATEAFRACSSLRNLELPDSIQYIYDNAFTGCSSIEEIVIPGSIRFGSYIESLNPYSGGGGSGGNYYGIFSNCTGLKIVTFKEGIKVIPQSMFNGCTSLVQVILPSSIRRISFDAFYDCPSLKQIKIPQGITELYGNCLGYYHSTLSGKIERVPGFTINGYSNTPAETYATDNNLNFIQVCNHDTSSDAGFDKISYKAATCTIDGHREYYRCPICGDIFMKNGAYLQETSLESLVIRATGHEWDYSQKIEGKYKCKRCDATTDEDPDVLYRWNSNALSSVPKSISDKGITSVSAIKTALENKITSEGYTGISLQYFSGDVKKSADNGNSWKDITEAEMPSEGVKAVISYDEIAAFNGKQAGLIPENYDYVIAQMTSLGDNAGTISMVADYQLGNDGITITLNTSGPIALGVVERERYKLSGTLNGVADVQNGTVTVTSKLDSSIQKTTYIQGGQYSVTGLDPGTYEVIAKGYGCVGRKYTVAIMTDTIQNLDMFRIGDADCDGRVDATDVTIIARHIAKIERCEDEYLLQLFDTDHNGEVSAADATRLARYLAGIINNL